MISHVLCTHDTRDIGRRFFFAWIHFMFSTAILLCKPIHLLVYLVAESKCNFLLYSSRLCCIEATSFSISSILFLSGLKIDSAYIYNLCFSLWSFCVFRRMTSFKNKRRLAAEEEMNSKRPQFEKMEQVSAQLKNESGEVLGSKLNLPINITVDKLQHVCNVLLKQVSLAAIISCDMY